MKYCLACNTERLVSTADCHNCGLKPSFIDGFESYAPEFSHNATGFKASYFSEFAHLEEANFWFQSRNELILWALQKYCPDFQSLFEIGCGTGYVLSGISKRFPHAKLYGGEILTAGLHFAAARLPSVDFMQMDARNIPFQEEFDVIGAFDVLEHIEEDACALSQIHQALKPGGFLLLAVPQHRWLWSPVDNHSCHVRRYEALDLHEKIKKAGFRIIRSTSFVTVLLPAMMTSRFFQSKNPTDDFDFTRELKLNPFLNLFFSKLLFFEREMIKRGCNFSVGGSRLVIASKE